MQIVERAGWIIALVIIAGLLVWKVGLPWLRKRRQMTHRHRHLIADEPID